MPEVIADLDTTVTSADEQEYYVQVAVEHIGSIWEAWLE